MNKFFTILLLAFSLNCSAEPFEDWTTTEKVLFTASQLTLIADYKTTTNLLYSSKAYYETNPFLGRNPSKQRVNLWFAGALVGNYFLSDYLVHEYRTTWLSALIVTELLYSSNNIKIGGKISF